MTTIWLAVDDDGTEKLYNLTPVRLNGWWHLTYSIELPAGSIEKLIGHKLTWADEPVMVEEEK